MPRLDFSKLARTGLRSLALATSTCVVAAAMATPATARHVDADRSAGALMAAQRLTASLNGSREVPGPGDRNGSGRVTLRVRPAAGRICAFAHWNDIGRPIAAHVHRGRAGISGAVVVDLSGSVTGGANCVSAPRILLRKIVAHPRAYYFNIHTNRFPGGAIRGQLH